MRSFELDTTHWAIPPPDGASSHHERHALSRRAFLGTVAGTAGAALGAGLIPSTVLAAKPVNPTPKPTTSTVTLPPPAPPITFHFTFFGPGIDPTSITDFNGFVGVADVQGKGTATNPDGTTETLLFDTDMRFMSGVYVGVDGGVHKGAFGFV
jgi:hypothetical protein